MDDTLERWMRQFELQRLERDCESCEVLVKLRCLVERRWEGTEFDLLVVRRYSTNSHGATICNVLQ